MEKIKGRFAPSPSGRMHLGNAFCALLAWLACRSAGGTMTLRVEDLDPERCRPTYAWRLMEDLEWMGLDWDQGPRPGQPPDRYWQSQRGEIYGRALEKLREQGLLYPCFCTRAELHAAQAPHAADGLFVYDGRCRSLSPERRRELAQKRKPARFQRSGSNFSTAARAFAGRTCKQSAAILSCAGPTALGLTSWPLSATTAPWASIKWSEAEICCRPRRASCCFTG